MKAKSDMWDTAKVNSNRIMMERHGASNHDMSDILETAMGKIYPWMAW